MRIGHGDVGCFVRSFSSVRAYVDDYAARFNDFGVWLFDELIDEATLVPRDKEEDVIASEVFARLEGVSLVDPYGCLSDD